MWEKYCWIYNWLQMAPLQSISAEILGRCIRPSLSARELQRIPHSEAWSSAREQFCCAPWNINSNEWGRISFTHEIESGWLWGQVARLPDPPQLRGPTPIAVHILWVRCAKALLGKGSHRVGGGLPANVCWHYIIYAALPRNAWVLLVVSLGFHIVHAWVRLVPLGGF